MLHRRAFVAGVVGLITAPAIVRAASIMPVSAIDYEFADPIISLAGMTHDGLFWRDLSGRKFSINPVGRFSIRVRGGTVVEQSYTPGGDVYEHADGLGTLGFARVGQLSDDDYKMDMAALHARLKHF